jgi:hypothetical protein
MSYSDFSLSTIESTFGVRTVTGKLFSNVAPATIPVWLQENLARGMALPLVSEKARSELIVMPVLLACRELSGDAISIFSGSRLDVDPAHGLQGECDFILARTQPVPEVRAPLIAIVEAKKNDIEGGLGQCVAQMIGARKFNEDAGQLASTIFGCVTTGEVWQFLRLEGNTATVDRTRLYLDNLPGIVGVFLEIIRPS